MKADLHETKANLDSEKREKEAEVARAKEELAKAKREVEAIMEKYKTSLDFMAKQACAMVIFWA